MFWFSYCEEEGRAWLIGRFLLCQMSFSILRMEISFKLFLGDTFEMVCLLISYILFGLFSTLKHYNEIAPLDGQTMIITLETGRNIVDLFIRTLLFIQHRTLILIYTVFYPSFWNSLMAYPISWTKNFQHPDFIAWILIISLM